MVRLKNSKPGDLVLLEGLGRGGFYRLDGSSLQLGEAMIAIKTSAHIYDLGGYKQRDVFGIMVREVCILEKNFKEVEDE